MRGDEKKNIYIDKLFANKPKLSMSVYSQYPIPIRSEMSEVFLRVFIRNEKKKKKIEQEK